MMSFFIFSPQLIGRMIRCKLSRAIRHAYRQSGHPPNEPIPSALSRTAKMWFARIGIYVGIVVSPRAIQPRAHCWATKVWPGKCCRPRPYRCPHLHTRSVELKDSTSHGELPVLLLVSEQTPVDGFDHKSSFARSRRRCDHSSQRQAMPLHKPPYNSESGLRISRDDGGAVPDRRVGRGWCWWRRR